MKRRFPVLALAALAVLAGAASQSTAAKPPSPPCTASMNFTVTFIT